MLHYVLIIMAFCVHITILSTRDTCTYKDYLVMEPSIFAAYIFVYTRIMTSFCVRRARTTFAPTTVQCDAPQLYSD